MKKLIVIADLGRVKAYEVHEGTLENGGHDHLIEIPEVAEEFEVKSVSETVTDQAGQFGGNAPGGASHAEELGLENEMERKNLNRVAAEIDGIIARSGKETVWKLAAPQSTLARLVDALKPATRENLGEQIGADLTREPRAKLEKRFL